MKLQRTLLITVALLALTFGNVGVGALGEIAPSEQVRLLVIDETEGIQSSLQIELFARALVDTGKFRIQALMDIPVEKNMAEAYNIVVIIPSMVDQVWIVTPDVPSQLTPALVQALHMVKSITDKMYEGERTLDPRAVVGVAEDLFPAVYSGFLVRNGWL